MDKIEGKIWMDLTNSLANWNGGIVGIVRAELEIAKNLKGYIPDLRYCVFTHHGFEEVQPEKINWLWTEKSIGDGYLKNRHRGKTQKNNEELGISASYYGLEEAYRYSASRKLRLIGGFKYFGKSLPRVIRFPIKLFYKAAVHTRNAINNRKRNKSLGQMDDAIRVFEHPFGESDLVFSCGWINSGKEAGFQQVKKNLTGLKLVYLVYDTIMYRSDTRRFYRPEWSAEFEKYLRWVSLNCIAVLTGGETAYKDMIEFQKDQMLPSLPGFPVIFGADITRDFTEPNAFAVKEYFQQIGIAGDYLIAVGSLDKRKNYDTLYRAYTVLSDRGWDDCPQLIIVGRGDAYEDLLITIKQDPRTMEQILFVTPTDEELNWLYKYAKFAVLASAYEGWSLTLPEALGYGKFVIASDNAPLREAGKDLIAYADTYDPYVWAEKIYYYCTHADVLKECEEKIQAEWKTTTWKECARQVGDHLQSIRKQLSVNSPNLYFDVTLTTKIAMSCGYISGILRSELMLLKHLNKLHPNMCFFHISDEFGYVSIDRSSLEPILYGSDIDKDFQQCQALLYNNMYGNRETRSSGTGSIASNQTRINMKKAFWLFISCLPLRKQGKYAEFCKGFIGKLRSKNNNLEIASEGSDDTSSSTPFSKNSVIFSCGIGYDAETNERMIAAKKRIGFQYCSVIYDFTPVIIPQTHSDETKNNYIPFLAFASKISDCILYGGKTAQTDGICYFKKLGLPIPPSHAIYFGSDAVHKHKIANQTTDHDTLFERGINRTYILVVGTIEARKNHETLYRAYLRMLNNCDDVPQLVFAGHPGWRTSSWLETMSYDNRVKGNILVFSPSDSELEILYRNCEFTILPSLYEGWSLTLPESYYYEKFCLCCDTPSLKETAGSLAEYIQPFDEVSWSKRIMYYYQNREELDKREKLIRENWHMISWAECAKQVYGYLKDMMDAKNVCIEVEK